jgi:hypothetical protein
MEAYNSSNGFHHLVYEENKMLLPEMTRQLAQRIEQNDIDYSLSRLGGMQQVQGNPLQIEIKRYGNVNVFLIRNWPNFWYGNKVLGLDPSSEIYLDEIINCLQDNLNFRFEIMPEPDSSCARFHKQVLPDGLQPAVYGPLLKTSPMNKSKSGKFTE